MQYTEDERRLARKIVAGLPSGSFTNDSSGVNEAALAAIRATTELAASHVDSHCPVVQCTSVAPIVSALMDAADSVRNGEHLK